jgi:hypothetical protein
MLALTAQHDVRALSQSVLAGNAAAGPLFSSETAEIV